MDASPSGLIVNRYSQHWTLFTSLRTENSSMVDVTRVIRTRMEIEFSVNYMRGGGAGDGDGDVGKAPLFEKVEKSIALASMTIENISVKEYVNGIGTDSDTISSDGRNSPIYSKYDIWSDKTSGFQFVRFWFSSPLGIGGEDQSEGKNQSQRFRSSTTIVMEYDILESVAGCRAVATASYAEEFDFDHCPEEKQDVASCSICREGFSAPWANDWSWKMEENFDLPILVFNATYRFGFETVLKIVDDSDLNLFNTTDIIVEKWIEGLYGPPKLECGDELEHDQCAQSPCEISSTGHGGASALLTSSSHPPLIISCTKLESRRKVSPERPTFYWSIQDGGVNLDPDYEFLHQEHSLLQSFITHCTNIDCPIHIKVGGSNHLASIVSGAILALPILGIIFLIGTGYKVRRRRRRRDLALAELGTGVVRQQLIAEQEQKEKGKMLRKLPKLAFGADEEQVSAAIWRYHKTHQNDSEDTKTEEDILEGAVTKQNGYQRQQVAYSSCSSCSICISDFKSGERVRVLPECGHIFHDKCIRKWLVGQNAAFCPLCHSVVFMDHKSKQ